MIVCVSLENTVLRATRRCAYSPWRPERRRWSRAAAAFRMLVASAATMADERAAEWWERKSCGDARPVP